MNDALETPVTYRSLADIRGRKEALLAGIRKDEGKMKGLWGSLFHKPGSQALSRPSRRLSTVWQAGAGMLDAFILGWKLYRKFKKK